MKKIPTAIDFIDKRFPDFESLDTGNIWVNIERAMVEFAKLHVEAALESASKKMFDNYHTICEDGKIKGVFKTQKEALDLANKLNARSKLYHDWVKVTRLIGGYGKESILTSYSPDNIE